LDIVFAVLSGEILKAGREALLEGGASRYKIAERNDWKRLDMPKRRETFILRRPFTERQLAALRRGHIPQEMEDKWFWFMEGDTLYAHRSWTGICIYRVDLKPGGDHVVTVNRDPEQYECASAEEDAQRLNDLLDRWTLDPYDHYNEWLAETADMLEKAGKLPEKP
jgi:8-oxo-dGTP diphosphatase